jgi:16S rRNA (guanine527-N7)-methyltransferase
MVPIMQENEVGLKEKLQQGLQLLGFEEQEQVEKLWQYLKLLNKWNRTYNLTAIDSLDEMISLHVLDSLSIHQYLKGETFLDIGTGAGLPGIPLAIFNPDKQFTLLDSNSKKTAFLVQVKAELKLNNVNVVCKRIEEYQAEKFDGIMSRAFSVLAEFINCSQHLAKNTSCWYAMKGPKAEQESEELPGYKIESIALTVPFLEKQRYLLIVENHE